MSMHYDKKKNPIENLNSFFGFVKVFRYTWASFKVDGKTKYHLESEWRNEAGLKSITHSFLDEFNNQLLQLSSTDNKNHRILLRRCNNILFKVSHHFKPSFHDILIIRKPDKLEKIPLIIHFESLPMKATLSIHRCYELIIVFIRQLQECVSEEIREFEGSEYVRVKSPYEWRGKKNNLAELSLAIFCSGSLQRKDGKKMKPSTLARDMASFFGVYKLNYENAIELLTFRKNRKKGAFLIHLKAKVAVELTRKLK